ncbi:MAG: trypsin-like peptidase domain-containing protein [candidate division Zixibacteria bacterium]|nr:trypsin-like peptidase domain-containing protein [candidate division Zixibacteria bacterium]
MSKATTDITIRSAKKGRKWLTVFFLLVIGAVFGLIISSSFDLPYTSSAQPYGNIAQSGAYPVTEKNGVVQSPFVEVVEKVQNAVVNISAQSREENVPWWFRRPGHSISSGSGFFFREDGYILTNNHVVKDAVKLTVRTATGFRYEAKLVGADPQTDLAVIKVEPEEDITAISFGDSDNLKVGDWAIAIGNPFPQQGLDRTVTVGVVSAVGRSQLNFGRETPYYQYYIQTDASINPGNSGGPLLNIRGEAIGVNAAISSPNGGSVGIGFAIPINLARSIVPDLIVSGRVHRGWLGVYLGNVTEREAKSQGMDAVLGVVIDSVYAGSPAEQAGIMNGDVIVGFDGQEVNDAAQFSVLVSTVDGGDNVPLEFIRDGVRQSVVASIGDRDTFLAENSQNVTNDDFEVYQWMGMELLTFTKEISRALKAKHVPGVLVRRIYPGTPANRSSIARGTIVMQINDVTIKSIDDVKQVAQKMRGSSSRISLIVLDPEGTISRKVLRP